MIKTVSAQKSINKEQTLCGISRTWYGCLMTSGIMECAAESSKAAVVAPVTDAARFPDRHASFSRQPCSPMTAPTGTFVDLSFSFR